MSKSVESRCPLPALVLFAAISATPGTAQEATTAGLSVTNIELGAVGIGENTFRATLTNIGEQAVLAVLDLRAVPGMWMIPNSQKQFGVRLAPRESRTVEESYRFQRLSVEGTLRVTVGPGEQRDNGGYRIDRVDFMETYPVGRTSVAAYDPATSFTLLRRGPLELYAWKGSLAERDLQALASERLSSLRTIQELLGIEGPDTVRMVFYADEETKVEQTGHQGIGWAIGRTIVEVYNEQIQLDPYHELAHIVAEEVGSPAAALGEGFAIYVTERLGADALQWLGFPGRAVHEVVCDLNGTPEIISLTQLLAVDNIGTDESRAGREYAEAGSFVKHLIERHGLDRFREAYGTLSGSDGPGENIGRLEAIYGRTVEELEREWIADAADACRGSQVPEL